MPRGAAPRAVPSHSRPCGSPPSRDHSERPPTPDPSRLSRYIIFFQLGRLADRAVAEPPSPTSTDCGRAGPLAGLLTLPTSTRSKAPLLTACPPRLRCTAAADSLLERTPSRFQHLSSPEATTSVPSRRCRTAKNACSPGTTVERSGQVRDTSPTSSTPKRQPDPSLTGSNSSDTGLGCVFPV